MENRNKAIKWWNELNVLNKAFYANKYSELLYQRHQSSLTGREIQIIYEKEIK